MSNEKVSNEEIKALKELKEAADGLLRSERLVKYGPNFKPESPCCSFCSKGSNEVNILVPGNDAQICDECVEAAQEIIKKQLEK